MTRCRPRPSAPPARPGCSWINYAVQPQVMPRLIGLSLYRLDINFRESAVIGIVGAGGIGATLNTAIDRYEYDSAGAILLIIIAIVMVLEYSSSYPAEVPAMPEISHYSQVWHRPQPRARGSALWAAGWCCRRVRLVLAADDEGHDLVLRLGRAAHRRRYRRPRLCRRAGPIMDNCGCRLWDTINIATLGTLGGVIMAVPVAFMAARNTTPSRDPQADRAVHHRGHALDQLADLGAAAGRDHRPGRVCRA
jgi:hypothetical protein